MVTRKQIQNSSQEQFKNEPFSQTYSSYSEESEKMPVDHFNNFIKKSPDSKNASTAADKRDLESCQSGEKLLLSNTKSAEQNHRKSFRILNKVVYKDEMYDNHR